MMKKVLLAVAVLLLIATAFFAGMKWQMMHLAEVPVYRLKEKILLQESPDSIGVLPAGATIYEYIAGGDTTTYFVFFNMQNQFIIEPKTFSGRFNIAPLDGYVESN